MLVGLSALSIPIWRCEELLSTLYDRIQDALTDDGDYDDDESEIREPLGTHHGEQRPGVGPGSGLTRPGPGPGSALTARGRDDSLPY